MLEKLFQEISKTLKLDAADKELCTRHFEMVTGRKNTILEQQNRVPQYLYFVNEGFLRLFYVDDNGDEVTSYFASPGGFIASFLNLIHQKPANENVGCITDGELLRISRQDLVTLIDKSENFRNFSLVIFERVIALTQARANDLATLSAELRYKKMITELPLLLKNIPIQYIASYLGIKSQSLSRIRRQLIL
jgi:CRP/FNR family transcriptional regulator, anaerobic regulatory protein